MIEVYTRSWFQRWLVDGLAHKLSRQKLVNANTITLLSVILGLLVPVALLLQANGWAIVALLASGYCDTLDGTLARFSQQASALGTAFDIVADRIVEFAVIVGFYLYQPAGRGLVCLLMIGSILICITSFLVVGIFIENNSAKGFYYSPGLIERPEAFLMFIFLMLFPPLFTILGSLFSALVLLTAAIRMWQFYRYCKTQAIH